MQKTIRTIPAAPTQPTRIRVAAYARVSNDKDAMLHSLAEQVSKYSRMIQSKAKCHGKKIPDTTLRAVITELLGLREYSAEAFTELIDTIYPYEGNRLVFAFKDGTIREATWKDRSRAESWTPEMKAKARENSKRRST